MVFYSAPDIWIYLKVPTLTQGCFKNSSYAVGKQIVLLILIPLLSGHVKLLLMAEGVDFVCTNEFYQYNVNILSQFGSYSVSEASMTVTSSCTHITVEKALLTAYELRVFTYGFYLSCKVA